jgi:apolipoprotein N-acyltransferase
MSKGWKTVAAEKGSLVQRTSNDGTEGVPARNPIFEIQNLKSPWAACALSGILLVACFPKIHLPGLVWVACLPLLVVLAGEKRLMRAFLLAYVCGAFFFAGSCYWFVIVMEFYGHLAPALAVVVLILFVIIDSTFFGAFGLAMGWAARRSPGWALALSPFLWMAMELARTYLITGFPWNLLGYAVQAPGVRQIAAVTGVCGLSFLAVATSALLAWVLMSGRVGRNSKFEIRNSKLQNRPVPSIARETPPVTSSFEFRVSSFGFRDLVSRASVLPLTVLFCWLVLLLVVQWRLAPPPATVGKELAFLVQPNVPLDDAALDAWAPWRDPTQLQQLVQFSVSAMERFSPNKVAATAARRDAGIDNRQSTIDNPPLLIWAENPAPFYFTRDPIFRNAMENMARETHAFVIGNTIIPMDEKGETITNSAFTLDPEGREVSRYDKIHLVPFGEYVPGWALPGLVHKITPEVGDFVPGSSYPVAKSPGGGIGVFICYEAIIPQLARRLVAAGAGVLVNISNDAWYGDSAAAYQHLEMARLRAIENHRYLLRATNNGLTTLIDPFGRVLEEIPRYERLVMPAHFDFETRQTFYSMHGDVFAWACAGVAGIMLLGGSLGQLKEQVKRQSAKGKRQK